MDGTAPQGNRTTLYCIVPHDVAAELHEPLRRHFRDEPRVEVIVEQRDQDRRRRSDRRTGTAHEPPPAERRRIRNLSGRRVDERRSLQLAVEALPLPRKAKAHAARLTFIERLQPSDQQAEDIDTARLVMRIQAGDRDAFADLYLRYFDRVYGYLQVVLRDGHEAEDATQQIFTQVLEALPRYERRPGHPFRAWLFTAVRNYALYQLRKSNRLDVTDPSDVSERQDRGRFEETELGALGWIDDRELLMFVERLPLAQRQVLLLRFMLDLTHAEIAEILDRSPEDVRILQHRALRFLRERLSALGRGAPNRTRERSRGYLRQRTVLRARRFALKM